jgi:hypothetical protein
MPILGKLTHSLIPARRVLESSARFAARAVQGDPLIGLMDEDGTNLSLTVRTKGNAGLERVCGAAGCTSAWMKPWKTRRRPVFEDAWACSSRCLETMVRGAVRREAGSGFAPEEPHRHRVPLGLVLLAQGWITHPQLQSALAAQRNSGQGRIGEWLTRKCGLPEDRIARGLGVQWNCPVLGLEGFSPRLMARVMPKRFVAEFGLVPLRVAGSSILYMAFQERMKTSAALSVEQMCGLKVESGLLTTTQLESAMARVLAADSVPVRIRQVTDTDVLTATIVKLLDQKQPVRSHLVRMEQYYWLRLWIEDVPTLGRATIPDTIRDMEDYIFLTA